MRRIRTYQKKVVSTDFLFFSAKTFFVVQKFGLLLHKKYLSFETPNNIYLIWSCELSFSSNMPRFSAYNTWVPSTGCLNLNVFPAEAAVLQHSLKASALTVCTTANSLYTSFRSVIHSFAFLNHCVCQWAKWKSVKFPCTSHPFSVNLRFLKK